MMLLYIRGRWRKERTREEQAGEVNQISGASLIGSANTARAAGCLGKGQGAGRAKNTFPGSLARLARLAARTFLFALGSALEVRFLAALRFTSDARNGDGGASANAGTGNSSYGSIPDSSVGEDGSGSVPSAPRRPVRE